MSDLRYDELEAAHDKLCADFNELMIERDRLFDEAEAGFKIRDGRIEALVKDLDATADRLNGSSAVIEGLNARIRKLEELVLAIEHDACGVYANCSDWFGVRDKLFS